jgi:type I restriction enzyme R subunit
MVARVLYPADDNDAAAVDQYDCIVVDECHRGYLLDRELSDTELGFRGYEDYISKYRRVLDYFDAVKIGLTATPALHTTQIFGPPVYTYSYREAVIDGYLVDYEPPVQITTELSASGIQLEGRRGGQGRTTSSATADRALHHAGRNQARGRCLQPQGHHREPSIAWSASTWPASWTRPSNRKTLIFCVNDAHADLVVELLKEAFARPTAALRTMPSSRSPAPPTSLCR